MRKGLWLRVYRWGRRLLAMGQRTGRAHAGDTGQSQLEVPEGALGPDRGVREGCQMERQAAPWRAEGWALGAEGSGAQRLAPGSRGLTSVVPVFPVKEGCGESSLLRTVGGMNASAAGWGEAGR